MLIVLLRLSSYTLFSVHDVEIGVIASTADETDVVLTLVKYRVRASVRTSRRC